MDEPGKSRTHPSEIKRETRGGTTQETTPTGRRRRPWSHAQAGSRKARGSSPPRGGRARLLRLRETVCGERLRHVGTDRGVRPGAHARDRAPALAPKLRLRRRAAGSLGAAGGAPVREHALRDQRVGAVPVRALCVSSAPQPGRRLADRPRAADLGGDAGRRRAASRAAVRAALGRHPGASRRSARAAGRAAPGCGSGSARTRSTSMSIPRAAPRRRPGCSATPPRVRSWCATGTAPTRNWPRTRRGL